MTPRFDWAAINPRRLCRAVAMAIALAWLAACTPLLSQRPAGDEPFPADAFWEGSWVPQGADAGASPGVSIRIKDAAKGELELVWLEQDGRQIDTRSETLLLRRAGPVLLASVPYSAFFKRNSAQGEPAVYAWARIERFGKEHIAISVPSLEGFRPHLGDKLRFLGKPQSQSTNRNAAVVPNVPADLLRQLEPGDQAWEAVIIYRKLPGIEPYPLRGMVPSSQ